MKTGIAILFICFFLSVSKGVYHPSFTSFSGYDASTLADVVYDASNDRGADAESLVAIYQDLMASSRNVYFLDRYLPPDRKPATIVLLGCGLVGLVGYGRWHFRK